VWAKLTDKVYVNNPYTLAELKDNIQVKILIVRELCHVAGTVLEGVMHACNQRVIIL
jgi:hypothetical protein